MKKKLVLVLFAAMGLLAFGQNASKASNTGRVLNICVWNEEFMSRVVDYYPGYNKVNNTIGKIKVNWILVPSMDNVYQNSLDEKLWRQEKASPNEKIDMFLVEPDYALKYIETSYVMDIKALGITEEDLSDQYQFAKDLGTDSKGNLKALSCYVCPGVFVYRRSMAKKVLGTDNPESVQKMINTWEKFDEVAQKMDKYNYYMLSGYDDSFRVFSDNRQSPWVVNGKINIDESMKKWVKQTKDYTDNMYNEATGLWSPEWLQGMLEDGKVFGYFGPAWFVDFIIPHSDWEYGSAFGDWAICKGPQSFNWGGTMICAATGTDNVDLVKDIMLKLTCDEEIMTDIAIECGDIVNNERVLTNLANRDCRNDFLGGQNPYKYYNLSAKSASCKFKTKYDQEMEEKFRQAMIDYFNGSVSEKEAYNNFYGEILQVYPDLER